MAGTRAHRQEGHATPGEPALPHPQRTPCDPRRRTPRTHAAEPRIGRRTDHTGLRQPATGNQTREGGHTHRGGRGYAHRGSRQEHGRAAHHHAFTAKRRSQPQQGPPHRHQKRKRARSQHPGLEARTPRGHGNKAQAPREGNPADTYLTHQLERHTRTPTARTQRATPHLTASLGHQTATLRPALRTTTRAGLTSTDPPRHSTRQHSTPHRSTPPCNTPRRGTPRHNTPQQNAARRRTARHTTARHGATQHNKAGRTATQHRPVRRSTAKHAETQHSAPQYTTTPKQGTLTEGLTHPSRSTPRKAPHQPATHRQWGHHAPGKDGCGPPTQTAARKRKPAPRRRRDTEDPSPPNPGPHETAWRNRPASRARS